MKRIVHIVFNWLLAALICRLMIYCALPNTIYANEEAYNNHNLTPFFEGKRWSR